MKGLVSDFRKFIMRGNVLDLAVAVIIGIAFNAVVNSLVNDVIMQIIAAIFGKPNFDNLTFNLGDGIILPVNCVLGWFPNKRYKIVPFTIPRKIIKSNSDEPVKFLALPIHNVWHVFAAN